MKTRTMNLAPDVISVEGHAWSRELPKLVLEEYDNSGAIKRVRIEIRPIDIEYLARNLWELRGKYEKALSDMTNALKGA